MDLRDRVAVVTGGASGIGKAMALRFAAEGARRVVVVDLNAEGAEAVAEEIGTDAAAGVACDVADEAALSEVLERFGPVDVFCANAGIGTGQGIDAPDEVWEQILDVNVRAHIIAARLLVPGWLERGEGYFVATASAAGVLTQVGDAPYSVTKHAAVAFAEWLAMTYGDQGIRVSALCPQGVRTPLLTGALDGHLAAKAVAAAGKILEPSEVASAVVDGLEAERFLILPHPEVAEFVRRKAADPDRWLAGLRRLVAGVQN